MQKTARTIIKVIVGEVIALIVAFSATAQKLPDKQEVSLRAPTNIKIDGKATEWDDKFQAYNSATDIFYTISNDDNNLYLTVQARLHEIEDKILRGGITFTINHGKAKSDEQAINITYPVLRDADMAMVANTLARQAIKQRDINGDAKLLEISRGDLNQVFDAKSKEINIIGIKAIKDASISVYNDIGIKAVAKFNTHVAYTYELAIPLKYLDLPNNGADAFSYRIKINEPAESKPPVYSGGRMPPPPPPMLTTSAEATYFWAEYTLAKK